MINYLCKVCGYVYEPETGDTDAEIEAGTECKDLPSDWVCPVCGADRDMFEEE